MNFRVTYYCYVASHEADSVPKDPDEFIRNVNGAHRSDFINLWRGATYIGYFPSITPALVTSSFAALDRLAVETVTKEMTRDDQEALQGILFTLVRRIKDTPSSAQHFCRLLASTHFHGDNASIAFICVRQFESFLSRYALFVNDHLIRVASNPVTLHVPSVMTLRAMAFKVLFELNSQYKHWSSLAVARDECIRACAAWGSEDNDRTRHYLRVGRQITRYVRSAT